MRFLEFKKNLEKFTLFSINDIKKIEPKFYRSRLNDWQEKGYIKKIRRGFYAFSGIKLNEQKLFLIANRLYSPSYVSLDIALSNYGLIPEGVYSVTSISTRKTKEFDTTLGSFSYRNVKPQVFFGYSLARIDDQEYKIAEIEKAVLDYFYLNPAMSDEDSFIEWRFNFQEFKANADMEKFKRYLKAFDNARMASRVERFLTFMEKENVNS